MSFKFQIEIAELQSEFALAEDPDDHDLDLDLGVHGRRTQNIGKINKGCQF